MQELSPLTISTSQKNKASVLLTKAYKLYVLHQPFSAHNYLNAELYAFLNTHFKIKLFQTGTFSFRGVKYLCYEDAEGSVVFEDWLAFQWTKKRQFNRFIQPKSLFYMFLLDLYFPVFGVSDKWIAPGTVDSFVGFPYPNNQSNIVFKPTDINRCGLNSPEVRQFFRFMKVQLSDCLEEFNALNHEKLRTDIKYRISLNPNLRNEYWTEFQQCFQPGFINYTTAIIKNYIVQL